MKEISGLAAVLLLSMDASDQPPSNPCADQFQESMFTEQLRGSMSAKLSGIVLKYIDQYKIWCGKS